MRYLWRSRYEGVGRLGDDAVTIAGMPETIGVLGEKILAMKFASGKFFPLYLAVITVEAKAGKVYRGQGPKLRASLRMLGQNLAKSSHKVFGHKNSF